MTSTETVTSTETEPLDEGDADLPAHYVNCGCGFHASSNNADTVLDLLRYHECPNAPQETPAPYHWLDSVFSGWGLLIALVVAIAVVRIVTGGPLLG